MCALALAPFLWSLPSAPAWPSPTKRVAICDPQVERTSCNPIVAAVCCSFLSRQAVLQETRQLLERYGGKLEYGDKPDRKRASGEGSLDWSLSDHSIS